MSQTQFGSTITPPSPEANGWFGQGAAISGDGHVMAIGYPYYSGAGSQRGCVAIYDWTGADWQLRGSVLVPSDPADADDFGWSVAMNSDGSVLAVGAPNWEGTAADQGGVYIYDWSGSAWSQRGSVIVATDAAANDHFGSGLGMSADGTILLIGAYAWEGPSTNTDVGAVYRYDWTGSAFTYTAYATGEDVTANNFGWSAAISGDGLVMAVGAIKYSGASSPFAGRVYIFDWISGAFSPRSGSPLTPGDSQDTDWFGSSVALNTDGSVMVVGAAGWFGSYDDSGKFYIYDWSGSAWTLRETPTESPAPSYEGHFASVALNADASIIVAGEPGRGGTYSHQGAAYTYGTAPFGVNTGTLSLDLDITVGRFGALSLPLAISTYATGALGLDLDITVTDSSSYADPESVWGFKIALDGTDITARCIGAIKVDAEEGAARLADFTYIPTGSFNPSQLTGQSVAIDYFHYIAGVAQPSVRIFTGYVDIPTLDVTNGFVSIKATDNRQNELQGAARAQIDALTPGSAWSKWVFADNLQGIEYADARLSTLQAALDKSAYGVFRLTAWAAHTTADFTYDASAHFYDTPSLEIARRDRLVNDVQIGFDYRFPRLKLRQLFYQWDASADGYALSGPVNTSFVCLPSKNMIADAIAETGWDLVYWEEARKSFTFGAGSTYVLDDLPDIWRFNAAVRKRWAQTLTEKYLLAVRADNSVSAVGDIIERESAAGSVEFDTSAWEKDPAMAPVITIPSLFFYGDLETNVTTQDNDGRAVADQAMSTLIARAIVRIKGSHRANRVSFSVPLDPRLDLVHTARLESAHLAAQGKIGQVVHTLDIDSGQATSEIVLYLSGVASVGSGSDPAATPPDPPNAPAPPVIDYVRELHSWTDFPPDLSLEGFIPCMADVAMAPQFRINTPEITDAERQPIDTPYINQTYTVVVPVDTLTWS